MSTRIYPFPLKPPSDIRTWSDWPEDVVGVLREWNHSRGGHRLSFWNSGVFKCPDCARFCASQPDGTSHLDGDPICDDCLIERVRSGPGKVK